MFFYSYHVRIDIFVSVDPLAESTMTPYQYVHQNPINLIDPTGMSAEMVDGPGDEFKNLEEAAKDFGKEYNGLSISYGIEVSTNFYEAKNDKGESYISYNQPIAGGGGMAPIVNNLKEGQNIVASGHTHGGDEGVLEFFEKGKKTHTSSSIRFSDTDIKTYDNTLIKSDGKPNNPFGKPIQGIVITPNGGILHYDPNKSYNMIKVKGIDGGLTPSYNSPIDTTMPSDPASKSLRLNTNSPSNMPKVKPLYFNKDVFKKREGY